LDLLTYTFGLKLDKARYTSKQLRAICSVAPQMMRAKGSRRAVELLCTALMHADGLEDAFSLNSSADNTELTIFLSTRATCKEVMMEILPYILPAGIVFNVIYTGISNAEAFDSLTMQDQVKINMQPKEPRTVELIEPTTLAETPGIFTYDDKHLPVLKPNLAIGARLVPPNATSIKN
jgi:hypothetical protein